MLTIITNMKKALFLCAYLLMGATTFTAKADLFNVGGVRTNIYSFSNKSFDGAKSESRSMPTITSISNNGPLNVIYIESDKSEVIVMGDENLFCRVQTKYKNGELNISLESGTYRNLWLQVVVYGPQLNQIKCTGSGDVKAEKVKSDAAEMSLKVTGSAVISIDKLECSRDLDMHISGSGDVRVKEATCQLLDINVTGSGDVKAGSVKYIKMDADVAGSGGIKIDNVEGNEAELDVKGSGDIRLNNGSTKYIKARVLGSGSIIGNVKSESIDQNTKGSGTIKFQ